MLVGADGLPTIPYDEQNVDTCPIRVVDLWTDLAGFAGWDMAICYFFPTNFKGGEGGTPVRGSHPVSASKPTGLLKQSAVAAGVQGGVSMPSFISGGAISRA